MKFQLALLLGVGAAIVLAAPHQGRQVNDLPDCKKGKDGPDSNLFFSGDCDNECVFTEDAEGDNKGLNCMGYCVYSMGGGMGSWSCRGKES